MTMSLKFGEFCVESEPFDRAAWPSAKQPDVEGPYNSNGDTKAACYPGHVDWQRFTHRWGLYEILGDELRGILRELPDAGAVAVEEEHATAYAEALGRYTRETGIDDLELERIRSKEAECALRCSRVADREHDYGKRRALIRQIQQEYNDILTVEYYDGLRLRWLAFWSRWALDNCRYPTLAFS